MSGPNEAQIEYWNGRAGDKWAALQGGLDRMLAPVTALLQARVGSVAGQRVLDIGCGTGQTCALWLAAGAEVTGVDVSAPMLAAAAARTKGRAQLIEADASTWRGPVLFDLALSRFGVMFFDDPQAAFANIAANVRPGGRLVFACWGPLDQNSWVTTPMAAVADLLPPGPAFNPIAPGPFALADRERLAGLLARAGWDEVEIEPQRVPVCVSGQAEAEGAAVNTAQLEGAGVEATVEAAVRFVMQIGPAGAALGEASAEVRALASQRLHAALAPHVQQGEVTLGGSIWLVQARRASA